MFSGQSRHIIIGTAGHVDHGKTELVKRLTGVDTDRLQEEKARGISIELGFAPLTLPDGQQAGIVDVPGHERFIKHMLAGVAGMDLVLLVVAADEGVMPQTKEHLDIINLLHIKKGIIVITKKDLVDEEWLMLVEEDIKETVKDTIFDGSPIIAVSSYTGEGIDELLQLINELIDKVAEKEVAGKVRLPIDRVFSITGFGTVVTGTLFSGKLKVGDSVEILPEGISTRVRNLQVHGDKVEEAKAGQRVAVNLTGIETKELQRGSVLLEPGYLTPSYRLDVRLEILPSASRKLKNLTRVRFYLNASETLGRVLLLESEELAPGARGYAQLVMEKPVVAARRDRFVIRSYSPMLTIGGGMVIDANPSKHKRFRSEIIQSMSTKEKGTPEEVILQYLLQARPPFIDQVQLETLTGIAEEELISGIERLLKEQQIISLKSEGMKYLIHAKLYANLQEEIQETLQKYHEKFPLRVGFSREELRSRKFSSLPVKIFNLLIQHWEKAGLISVIGQNITLKNYQPQLTPQQQEIIENILHLYKKEKIQTPSWKEVCQTLSLDETTGEEFLNYCLNQKLLIKIAEGIYVYKDIFEEVKEALVKYLQEHPHITISEARDLLGGSRKFILPLLEYLDREKITRRVGDKRVLF